MEDFGPFCGFFLVMLVIGGFIAIVVAAAAARNKELNETYGSLARQYRGKLHGGSWFDRPSVTFDHGGNWVRVDIHSTGGKNPTYYTQVHMGWPEPGFRMEVYPEGFFHRFGKFLGLEDIEIGSPQFDREYIITSNDAHMLRETLNSEAQATVTALREVGRSGNIYVAVRNYELLVKKLGLIDEIGPLLRLTELSLAFHDAAMAAQKKGIQFISSENADPTQLSAGASAEDVICQVCGDKIVADVVFCRGCKTPHHHDCWQYYGQCSTFGCGQRDYRWGKKQSNRRRT